MVCGFFLACLLCRRREGEFEEELEWYIYNRVIVLFFSSCCLVNILLYSGHGWRVVFGGRRG